MSKRGCANLITISPKPVYYTDIHFRVRVRKNIPTISSNVLLVLTFAKNSVPAQYEQVIGVDIYRAISEPPRSI